MNPVLIMPIEGVPEVEVGDDIGALLVAAMAAQGAQIQPDDIVVVTSKVVSKAEGLAAGPAARADLVLQESTRVVSERATATGVTRVVAAKAGPVMAGAGIDASNVGAHDALLLPHDPDHSATQIRAQLIAAGTPERIGVIVSDTAGRPWRAGLTDFALGIAGVRALDDLRGATDADGRAMAVTIRCIADEIAAAGDLVKGKVDGVPAALVRGLAPWVGEGPSARELVRSGPDDWFALGRAEAVRDALGVAAGSPESAAIGIESVHPEPLEERMSRAARVANVGLATDVKWEIRSTTLIAFSPHPLRLGRWWGRVEVALAGERLTAESVSESPGRIEIKVSEGERR